MKATMKVAAPWRVFGALSSEPTLIPYPTFVFAPIAFPGFASIISALEVSGG
jgi:hypothetical protein